MPRARSTHSQLCIIIYLLPIYVNLFVTYLFLPVCNKWVIIYIQYVSVLGTSWRHYYLEQPSMCECRILVSLIKLKRFTLVIIIFSV